MKYFIYLLLIIVLTGLSLGLAPVVRVLDQVPLVLFLLALVWSLEKQDNDFLFIALAAGIFMDVSSGNIIGIFTLPLLVLCFTVHTLGENFFALELSGRHLLWLVPPAQAAFYFLFYGAAWLFMKLRLPVLVPDRHMLLRSFIAVCFYNLLLVYPISLLIDAVKVFVSKHIEKEYKLK